MIICRTPFRISFFGGGTDYPIWYREHGGKVISTTINKYSYITTRWLPPFFDYKYRIRYHVKEDAKSLDDIKHPSVRECAKFLGIKDGIEVVHSADLPARSGLGSSSTFTVGMLHSLYTLNNEMVTKRQLALQAIDIEQNIIGESVGSQDQTAAAFGGFNVIRFGGVNNFEIDPVVIAFDRQQEFQDNLLLVFTGFSRTASEVAAVQIELTPSKKSEISEIAQLCDEAHRILVDKSVSVDELGIILHEQWKIKRSLTPLITNEHIDKIYDVASKNGAIGGKLLGAGGGGFMLFYALKENHAAIKAALHQYMFVPFKFESNGSQIIYFTQ